MSNSLIGEWDQKFGLIVYRSSMSERMQRHQLISAVNAIDRCHAKEQRWEKHKLKKNVSDGINDKCLDIRVIGLLSSQIQFLNMKNKDNLTY